MRSQHPTDSEEFEAIVARSFAPATGVQDWTDLTFVARTTAPPAPLPRRIVAAARSARTRRHESKLARGEARVAHQLGRLPDGWHVLHPVPVGQRADDRVHLVVGPGGVFTLDTQFHPSSKIWSNGEALWVNGRRTHELASSRFAADRAGEVLTRAVGVPVVAESVVVMVGSGLASAGEPDRVHLVYLELLVRWMKAREHVLAPDAVDAIVDRARRSTTWSR